MGMCRNQAVAGAALCLAALALRGVEAILPMAEMRLTSTPGFVYAAPAVSRVVPNKTDAHT
jgi:hypothetical protein